MYHSRQFVEALRGSLTDMPVALAMRYGDPNIAHGVAELADCDEIFLIAAYPHHADSTRTTTIRAVEAALQPGQRLTVVPPFYQAIRATSAALAASIRASTCLPDFDHLLFSYHGLPERHLTQG